MVTGFSETARKRLFDSTYCLYQVAIDFASRFQKYFTIVPFCSFPDHFRARCKSPSSRYSGARGRGEGPAFAGVSPLLPTPLLPGRGEKDAPSPPTPLPPGRGEQDHPSPRITGGRGDWDR